MSVYCPKRRGQVIVPLRPTKHGSRYHLIVDSNIDGYLHRNVVVRSPLMIRNETSYALQLYYKKQSLEKLQVDLIGDVLNPFDDNIRLTILEPDETYYVPLFIAYHFPLYILPAYLQ